MRATIMNGSFICLGCCALVFSLFMIQGCAEPHLSENYGRSYDAVSNAQVVNPGAPRDSASVDGCPGVVAEAIYSEYLNSVGGESGDTSSGKGTDKEGTRKSTSGSLSKKNE